MSPITVIQNELNTHTLGVFEIPEQNLWCLLAGLPEDLPYRVWRSEAGEHHLCAGVAFSASAAHLSELPTALAASAGTFFQDAASRAGLIALVASAFDPANTSSEFPALTIWLPKWTIRHVEDSWRLLVLAPSAEFKASCAQALSLANSARQDTLRALQTASKPQIRPVADTDYIRAVEDALAFVSSANDAPSNRQLSKIVIARRRTFKSSAPFHVPVILASLDARFSNCYVFADRPQPEAPVFLGASPERLLTSFNGVLATEALAGSTSRGRTPDEDAQLGEALLASEKDLREHNHVKEYVRRHLSEVCEDVVFGQLGIKKLANVQHLHTPVSARLKPGKSLLEAAEPLHPTSAVGGEPRDMAMQLIRQIEGFDRGFYAGLIGWITPADTQDGELCVAIRSAVIAGDEAKLFAGAGIVEGSDSELEDRETQIKMQAILEALS